MSRIEHKLVLSGIQDQLLVRQTCLINKATKSSGITCKLFSTSHKKLRINKADCSQVVNRQQGLKRTLAHTTTDCQCSKGLQPQASRLRDELLFQGMGLFLVCLLLREQLYINPLGHFSNQAQSPPLLPALNRVPLHIYFYITRDLSGSPIVKELPCNAREAGSIPGCGTKIPHATEQLNRCCNY